MKVGDLVRHKEDEVLGLVVGSNPEYMKGKRLRIQWFDCTATNEEDPSWVYLVSEAPRKGQSSESR